MSPKSAYTLLLLAICTVHAQENPMVKTSQGSIKGKYDVTSSGRKISSFTSIPYAKPPVGELRFKPSEAADPWKESLDATKQHAVCPQKENQLIIGDEDCLYLNVYTPETFDSTELKSNFPVLFYIHGGAWSTGSANDYGPELLLNKDVILVTANYRLGPLGFFSSGTPHVMGNGGLKDQVLVLKWIKHNIANFGGDPERITVFGHSTGGASAHYLSLSPLSKDLVKGAIAQSGTALSHLALMPHFLATRYSKYIAHDVGCKMYEVDLMMECIRKVDAHEIIIKSHASIFHRWDIEPLAVFKPVIEANVPGAFLPEDPIDIIKSGKTAPLITGLVTGEGDIRAEAIFSNSKLFQDFAQNFTTLAPVVFSYDESTAHKYLKNATDAIKTFYFNGGPIKESSKEEFSRAYADALHLHGADATVNLHVKWTKQPIYYYLFGHKGFKSFCSKNAQNHGVCHGDELFHLLNLKTFPNYQSTESDKAVSELMTTLWVNFATYGNPTPDLDSGVSINWDPVAKDKQNYLLIKEQGEVGLEIDLYPERSRFWRNLDLSVRTIKIRDEL